MTAGELIRALQAVDPSTPVVVDGYESGLCDVLCVRSVTMAPNVMDEDYAGPHAEVAPEREDRFEFPADAPTVAAIHVSRYEA